MTLPPSSEKPPSGPGALVTMDPPIREASNKSLEDLFSMDPMNMQEQDIVAIVDKLRDQRKSFLLEEETAKAAPKGKKIAADPNLTLDSLDIKF